MTLCRPRDGRGIVWSTAVLININMATKAVLTLFPLVALSDPHRTFPSVFHSSLFRRDSSNVGLAASINVHFNV